MNRCFIIAKIIKNEGFKFIIEKKNKHKSQVVLEILLSNNSVFKAVGYDKIADYILQNDITNEFVFIDGKLVFSKKINQIVIDINFIKKI